MVKVVSHKDVLPATSPVSDEGCLLPACTACISQMQQPREIVKRRLQGPKLVGSGARADGLKGVEGGRPGGRCVTVLE